MSRSHSIKENGYGFNIIGGIDQPYLPNDSGIFISKIGRKGSASKNGMLAIGDKILSVNGESCEGVTHHSTLEMFHKALDKVDLVIQPHAEAYLRQQYLASLNRSSRHRVSFKGTVLFLTKATISLAAVYYLLRKLKILSPRGKLLIPAKEIPSAILNSTVDYGKQIYEKVSQPLK